MTIIPKQIGWSQESNLLWSVLKELNKLGGAISNLVLQTKPKYKVFTALLTQSGTSYGPPNIFSGPVTQGVTYTLLGVSNVSDFSNVGGPAAEFAVDGMHFIATATLEPNNYGGGGLIYDTGAPVATILENTIGNVWFVYLGVGNYACYSSTPVFTFNKTTLNSEIFYNNNNDYMMAMISNIGDFDVQSVVFSTTRITGSEYPEDNALQNTFFEIRIYN